jgi:hypothetical protein
LPIKGIKLSKGGGNPKDFSISQTSSSLAPGDTITVKIRFSPSRNGIRTAVLTVATANAGKAALKLKGSGN